jgi:cell division protein FtsL
VVQWWKNLSGREKTLLKVLGALMFALVFFQGYIYPVAVGSFKRIRQLSLIETQIHTESTRLQALKDEVDTVSAKIRERVMEQKIHKNAVPLLLEHLGREQDRLGFVLEFVGMPNAPQENGIISVQQMVQAAQAAQAAQAIQTAQPGQAGSAAAALPASDGELGKYLKVELNLKLRGSYIQLGKFLEGLKSLPILWVVKRVEIERMAEGAPNRVDVTLQVITRKESV